MTVTSATARKSFTGDAVTTSFGTSPMVFFDDADLTVYVVTTATGASTTLTLDTHYTVSGGDGSAGTVSLAGGSSPYGAPSAAQTLVIVREVAVTQSSDFINNDPSDAEVVEDALDRLTMIAQQNASVGDRSLRLADSNPSSAIDTEVTALATMAGYYLRMNTDGDGFELADGDVSTSTFTASGTGAVERSITSKLGEIISVKDFGATGDGTTDDYAAIALAVTAAAGKVLYFPAGTYSISATINVTDSNTKLIGDGFSTTSIKNAQTNGDAIVFKPSSITTNSTYINNCSIQGMYVYRNTSATTGAGIRLTQCNGFLLRDVVVLDFPEGIVVEGGQLNTLDSFKVFFSALTGSPLANSSMLKFTSKQALDASYRQAFTTQVSNFVLSGANVCDAALLIQACDGLSFSNCYIANAYQALVRLKPNVDGEDISCVNFSNYYLDGVSNTENGIEILDDGFAATTFINNVNFASEGTVGNLDAKGLYSTHPYVVTFSFDPAVLINVAGAEVDVAGGDVSGDSFIGVPLPWTPVISCATPGDLTVAYSTQLGTYLRKRDGTATVSFNLVTSTFTHTTASGALYITGVPAASASSPSIRPMGSFTFGGITKASYTQFTPQISTSTTVIQFTASGSAQAIADLDITDLPTASTKTLRGTLSYYCGELG